MNVFNDAFSVATNKDIALTENSLKAPNSTCPIYVSEVVMLSRTKAAKFVASYDGGIKIEFGKFFYDAEDKELEFAKRFELAKIGNYWKLREDYLLGSPKYKHEFMGYYRLTRKLSRKYNSFQFN